ncbi:MAG: hypothetical protein AB7U38_01925 [Hyphomicrobiales bacterium]
MSTDGRISLTLWRWQRRSALLLAPLLVFHVAYQYFYVGMDAISFDTVSDKLQFALFIVVDLLLLAAVAVHAFTGLRSIALDYTSAPGSIRAITTALVLAFLLTVVYAVAALIYFL